MRSPAGRARSRIWRSSSASYHEPTNTKRADGCSSRTRRAASTDSKSPLRSRRLLRKSTVFGSGSCPLRPGSGVPFGTTAIRSGGISPSNIRFSDAPMTPIESTFESVKRIHQRNSLPRPR